MSCAAGRRLSLIALCLAVVLTACGGNVAPASPSTTGAAAPEVTHVKLSYGTLDGTETFVRVAAEKGLFQKYGLSADASYAETTASIASLASGEVQFAITGGPDVIGAIASGARLKIIAVFNRLSPYVIIGLPDIKQPSDLRGKTAAIAKVGDTSDVAMRIGLKLMGLEANKDVRLLQVGGSAARFAALTSQQVQGAVVDSNFVKRAEAQGMHVLVDMTKSPYAAGALSAQQDFLTASPNTTLAVLRGLVDGLKYFTDEKNKPEMLAAIAKDAKLERNDPQLAEIWDGMRARGTDASPSKEGVQSILDAERGIDAAHFGSLTTEQIIDPSFAAKLGS